MTDQRSPGGPTPDDPITGVAAGNLGTGANLDDTQILRTEDLRAATPGWLTEEGPPESSSAPAPASPTATISIPPRVEPVAATRTAPRRRSHAASPGSLPRERRRLPLAAGAAALLVLVLIAGSAILSQLDFGTAQGVDAGDSAPAATAPAPPATPAPKPHSNKGPGDGGGKGHGGGCHGGGNCD